MSLTYEVVLTKSPGFCVTFSIAVLNNKVLCVPQLLQILDAYGDHCQKFLTKGKKSCGNHFWEYELKVQVSDVIVSKPLILKVT